MICRRWVPLLLSVLLLFLAAPPAHAACHAFTVAVSPDTVDEGRTVRITVSRDAGVNPSSIDVSTIDESARAGSDYGAINETVSFASETTKTLTLRTTDDAASEPAETFRVHLSNPGGCAVNPNFSVGPDAQVTIKASDAPTTTVSVSTTATEPTGTTVPEESPGQTTTTGAGTDDTATDTTDTTNTTDATDTTIASTTTGIDEAGEDDNGGGAPIGAIAAVVLLAGAAGAMVLFLRRSR